MSLRTLWTLYVREMRSIFVSPVAYVVLAGCALLTGGGFAMFLEAMIENNVRGYSLLSAVLDSFIFWFTVMVQAPIITMRTFSEEYKLGTIEMLLTAPVREWEVVLAKFGAVLSFFIVLWLPIALDTSFLYLFSNQPFDLTWGMVAMPFLMVLLVGMFYIAIGLFASSLTRNQIIAAILSFAFIFTAFCFGLLGAFSFGESVREGIGYVSNIQHMETFCRGILDTRPLVFYLTGTFFFLFLTQRVLQGRRLRA